ncbi:hypothetical protein [Devosia sp. FKR38]|uniref:hypothetical protein n=1 Tax=Devosia sp. FKR38 TaxID=2562312 RepID=UPI0010C0B373|nr:hypothetical protein [Devosia sp. FKR38]
MAVVAVFAIALGARTVIGESRFYLATANTAPGRIIDVAEGRADIGLATQSQKSFLLDCAQTMTTLLSADVLALTPEHRSQLAPSCRTIAQRAVAASPTNSFAYFVQAAAAAALDDKVAYNQSLQLSYLTGRNEEWIAEWRLLLVERQGDRTNADLATYHDDDIRLMIRSFRGISTIAAYFVSREDFRDRVTTLLDSLPPADQSRFLSYVRRQIG